jgi:preprotein translocase SecE subunit
MAAPARTPAVRTGAGGGGIVRFAQECWSELQKVTWPDRQTIMRLTVVVLVISALVGVYILAADQVFTFAMNTVLGPPASPAPGAP